MTSFEKRLAELEEKMRSVQKIIEADQRTFETHRSITKTSMQTDQILAARIKVLEAVMFNDPEKMKEAKEEYAKLCLDIDHPS